MESTLFFFLFLIFFLTFSSNEIKKHNKRKRYLLKTQEKENLNIPVNLLLNTHDDATSSNVSCTLLDLKPDHFRYIFAYLSFFELELNFKYVSPTIYHLCENFSQKEKKHLKLHLKNEVNFLANMDYLRVYFDFFEKRVWNVPGRIEYANVDFFF